MHFLKFNTDLIKAQNKYQVILIPNSWQERSAQLRKWENCPLEFGA